MKTIKNKNIDHKPLRLESYKSKFLEYEYLKKYLICPIGLKESNYFDMNKHKSLTMLIFFFHDTVTHTTFPAVVNF